MKKINIVQIIVIFILIVSASCKEKESIEDYNSVNFRFVLTDSIGNNLFFGDNSPYDSSEVKLKTESMSPAWSILTSQDTSWFYLGGFYVSWIGAREDIYIEFFPGNVDTVTISNSPDDDGTPSLDFNAAFNSEIICTKCEDKIHKIVVK